MGNGTGGWLPRAAEAVRLRGRCFTETRLCRSHEREDVEMFKVDKNNNQFNKMRRCYYGVP